MEITVKRRVLDVDSGKEGLAECTGELFECCGYQFCIFCGVKNEDDIGNIWFIELSTGLSAWSQVIWDANKEEIKQIIERAKSETKSRIINHPEAIKRKFIAYGSKHLNEHIKVE